MQAVTHIAPAAGVVLSIQLITQHAGITAPLAFLIGFGIVLTLGISLTQLARQFPSAGGYYTYVSRTMHPRAGFLTAWLYFLYDPICAAINLAYMGYLLEKTLWADLNVVLPWWAFLTAAAVGIALLTCRRIRALCAAELLNSVLAVSISSTNAAARVFYAMGRAGALPAWLGTVHARFQTPSKALWLQTLITLAVGVGLGLPMGPFQEFEFLAAVLSLAVMVVYAMGNIGVFLYYRRQRRQEFNTLLHAIFPMFSALAILVVAWFSAFPLPEPPLRYAPLVVLLRLMIGIVLLAVGRSIGRERSLLGAGTAAYAKPFLPGLPPVGRGTAKQPDDVIPPAVGQRGEAP